MTKQTTIHDVIEALKQVVEVKADSDVRGHVTGYAPDSSEPEYGGNTEPGSSWDEECDARLTQIQESLPAGWTAEWLDNDVVIERTATDPVAEIEYSITRGRLGYRENQGGHTRLILTPTTDADGTIQVYDYSSIGSGTPMPVWNGLAVSFGDLQGQDGATVQSVLEEHHELILELNSLFEGSRWDGHNHVGVWSDHDRRCQILDELSEELRRGSVHYWDAGEYFGGDEPTVTAELLRAVASGTSISDWAHNEVDGARESGALIDYTAAVDWATEKLAECKVKVGDVTEVHDDGDGMAYYVEVEVEIGDVAADGVETVSVSCMVGVEDHLHGTIKASGSGIPDCAITAWWSDSSDHSEVDRLLVEHVLSALVSASKRLFSEASALQQPEEEEEEEPEDPELSTYTYTIYDANPNATGPCSWPSHDGLEVEAKDDGDAISQVRDALEIAAVGLSGPDYDVGDVLYAHVFRPDTTIASTITYTLTEEDLA